MNVATQVATQVATAAPKSTTISTTAPLTGGGNLTANRTLGISPAGAATATADGSAGSAIYAKDSDTTSRNKSATPMNVATQIAAIGFTRQTIASSGTFSAPVAGCYRVVCIGGGGGGGGVDTTVTSIRSAAGGGGGGGGWVEGYVYLTKGQSVSCTIGAGGAGVAGENGKVGGTTKFGTFLQATGGGGGGASYGVPTNIGSDGGIGNILDSTVKGSVGKGNCGAHSSIVNDVHVISGWGGGSYLGGGPVLEFLTSNGKAGTLYGEGGSGGAIVSASKKVAGGNGAPGVILIDYHMGV
jgi:hypothetical protein